VSAARRNGELLARRDGEATARAGCLKPGATVLAEACARVVLSLAPGTRHAGVFRQPRWSRSERWAESTGPGLAWSDTNVEGDQTVDAPHMGMIPDAGVIPRSGTLLSAEALAGLRAGCSLPAPVRTRRLRVVPRAREPEMGRIC
jgi:hypothetical protein